jgi:amino acid permease
VDRLNIGVNREYGYTNMFMIFLSLPIIIGMTLIINFNFWDVLCPHPQLPQSRRRVYYLFWHENPFISVFVPSYHVNGILHRHNETKCWMQHDTSTDSSTANPAPTNGHSQYRLQQHATSDSNWVIIINL